MTQPPTNDIDLLMSLDPLELTHDDLSAIVLYHRDLRAQREAGKGKAAAKAARGSGVKLDIASLMSSIVTPQVGGGASIKRRV